MATLFIVLNVCYNNLYAAAAFVTIAVNPEGGINVDCPYCNNEMKQGTLNWYSGNIFWLPEGTKPPQRESEYVEGAVQLEQDYNGLRPYLSCSFCSTCRKVVIDV